jgi:hypothetical protein
VGTKNLQKNNAFGGKNSKNSSAALSSKAEISRFDKREIKYCPMFQIQNTLSGANRANPKTLGREKSES